MQTALLNLLVRYYPATIVKPLLQTWLAGQPLRAALDLPELAEVKAVIANQAGLTDLFSWRLVTTRKVTDWLAAKLNTRGQTAFVTTVEKVKRATKKQITLKSEQLVALLEELQARWLTARDSSRTKRA